MGKANEPKQAAHKETVIVVDDDDSVRRQLYWTLNSDYRVLEARTRAEVVKLMQQEAVGVVVSDLHLPPHLDDISEGLAIVEAARLKTPPAQVVVITGSESKDAAHEAVRRGAYGFFEKPLEADAVRISLQAARMYGWKSKTPVCALNRWVLRVCRLIGTSASLGKTVKQARAVAATNATVLIIGENGTGKEILARAIHEESPRSDRPFIAVSCAALTESLIESELFGHEKGAFTSAIQARMGRFELADGGTLFLDEVVELSQSVQVKLLRVLQERAFERAAARKL